MEQLVDQFTRGEEDAPYVLKQAVARRLEPKSKSGPPVGESFRVFFFGVVILDSDCLTRF